MSIQWDKPIETVDGIPAVCVWTTKNESKLIVLPASNTTFWTDPDGRGGPGVHNVPETVSRWKNEYSKWLAPWYASREEADKHRRDDCLYVIREDCRDGERTITIEDV